MSTFDDSSLRRELDSLMNVSNDVMKEAHKLFVSYTPKKTGNARRNTKVKGDTITADYAYASELDAGKSKQAPKGMTEPTIKDLNKLVDRAVKKRSK